MLLKADFGIFHCDLALQSRQRNTETFIGFDCYFHNNFLPFSFQFS